MSRFCSSVITFFRMSISHKTFVDKSDTAYHRKPVNINIASCIIQLCFDFHCAGRMWHQFVPPAYLHLSHTHSFETPVKKCAEVISSNPSTYCRSYVSFYEFQTSTRYFWDIFFWMFVVCSKIIFLGLRVSGAFYTTGGVVCVIFIIPMQTIPVHDA